TSVRYAVAPMPIAPLIAPAAPMPAASAAVTHQLKGRRGAKLDRAGFGRRGCRLCRHGRQCCRAYEGKNYCAHTSLSRSSATAVWIAAAIVAIRAILAAGARRKQARPKDRLAGGGSGIRT